MVIDQDTIISNNSAGRNGGGLWSNILNLPALQHVTLSKVTITGNTATSDGGGIHVDSAAAAQGNNLTISFSRLAGNTGGTGSNLGNVTGSVTATNNWWGINTPATTINNGSPAVTFDPFIVLTHIANPSTIKINQSTTLTADMTKDNHGSGVALSGNLDRIFGIPITFNTAIDGTISNDEKAIQPVNVVSATESGSTVTITTSTTQGYVAGETVVIAGVGVAGYNGTFTIATTPTPTTFTYTNAITGLGNSSGGTSAVGVSGTATATFTAGNMAGGGKADAMVDQATVTANIIVLEPLKITKSFGAARRRCRHVRS